MSYATFLADQTAVRDRGDFLVELYPKNPSGVVSVIRFSRRGTAIPSSAITIDTDTIPAHTLYHKRLLKAPTMTQSIWSPGQILSSSLPSFGSGLFNNADGGLDQYRDWTFAGCNYKVFLCDSANAQNTIGKIADGIMGNPQFGLSVLEIPFLGRESLFNTPLSTHVYRGTGYMLELAGVRSASFGSPAPVNITGALTVEGWRWIETVPSAPVSLYGWPLATGRPWAVFLETSLQMSLRCSIGGVAEIVTTTVTLPVQTFFHYAFIVSGRDVTFLLWKDDTQTLITETFLNGFSSATRQANSGGTLTQQSGGALVIWIDEERVWNVARTASEIRADRYRPISPNAIPATLVHYLTMDDGSGTNVTDSSATAAHGTISGAGTSTWLHSQEGGPELAGVPKPYCSGERFGCAPVLVDGVRQGYQAAGGGAFQDINSFEGGAPHTMIASAASFRTYLTTTPAAGTSLRYLPRGLFKLGSAPLLPISATVKGYNDGALGYVDKGGTVTRDIVTRRGPKLVDPTNLDTAAFTAYASANPGIIGLYHKAPSSQVTLRTELDSILKSGAGYWGYTRASTLFTLKKFAGPAVSADYDILPKQIIRNSLTPITIESVIWKVVVRYRQNSVVLSEDQVAASIKSTSNWQQWTIEWQEKEDHDDEILEQYPGSASTVLTLDTLLQYETDAQNLATYVLGVLKGKKLGWSLTIGAGGLEATIDETATVLMYHQDEIVRLGLDGVDKYSILTVEDNRQEGLVKMQLWGSES